MISIKKLFKDSFTIYVKQFKTLILITALTFLPMIAIQSLAEQYQNNIKTINNPTINILFICFILLALFILWTGKGAIIKNIADKVEIRESLNFGWNNLTSIIWVDILSSIIIFAGFILFIIPGIIFSVWFAFSLMVLILDNKKGWNALKYSKKLTQGKWWGVFGRLIIILAINVLLYSIVLISDNKAITDTIFNIVMIFFAPFIFSYIYVIYKNLKGGAK